MDPAEFAAWLRLLETPGVGRGSARRLLASFGSPEAVFEANPAVLREVVGGAVAAALGQPPPEFAARLQAARDWLQGDGPRQLLPLGDVRYPAALLNTADPPLLLYVQGAIDLLGAPSVAVVGSRSTTPQGLDHARSFAKSFSDGGFVVVSGLAQGIDGAAHDGALQGAAGTIAVVGTGPDRVYPSRHRSLAHRIVAAGECGAIVSEFAPGTPPLAENFPQRNRIIAGLSLGTLVVEAALRSGSLITARLAAEAGREVFAIPGSILAPQSRGCHELIRQGAQLVETPDEILDVLCGLRKRTSATFSQAPPASTESSETSETSPSDPLLEALGHDPITLDALMARTGWPAHELAGKLLELELADRVARLPGGLYQRRSSS